MKILVLTKRQYTGKDLIDDMYGRMFEIPEALNLLGHDVKGLTLSYRRKPPGEFKPKSVIWRSVNCFPFSPIGSILYLVTIYKEIKRYSPDIIWTSSDAWHLISAWIISKITNIKYVVDFYDNYESFGMSNLAPQKWLMKLSARSASGITVASNSLQMYILKQYTTSVSILPLGNAADSAKFRPMSQSECREKLGLPKDKILVGTAGSLSRSRGIEVLFKAFKLLSDKVENSNLVVAGPRDFNIKKLNLPNIIDLGIVEYSDIPIFLNALDLVIICNTNSSFGRYCYPQKYAEIVCCNRNFVAADIGEMALILKDNPEYLFRYDDHSDLCEKVFNLLLHSKHSTYHPITWHDRAVELESYLLNKVLTHDPVNRVNGN
jgi:glycosyltransferase involved in cell wall biosynthesis